MQYSFYVRMLIEEFLSIFITCLINVMRPKYNTWGEILSFSLAIILIVRNSSIIFLDIAFVATFNPDVLHSFKKVDRSKAIKIR